jgi:Cell division protein CrgA
MPESKGRGIPKQQPSQPVGRAEKGPSPRWLVVLMITLFLLGLLWIVVYYLVPTAPVLESLGSWNMVIGFGLILGGFVLSTRWR